MTGFMGFGSKWRSWIALCLKTAYISVLVNGSHTKEFKLGRGVRQGDPLSPFLFIIAAEGLNWLIKSALSNNAYSGVKVGNDNIPLTHLQYADDTLFFGTWSLDNIENLMKLLKCFELCSGLKVNYNKSNLFGVGVDKKDVEYMANLFGCKVGTFPFTYLGLPIGANMKKSGSWKPVIEKFEKRLSDWKACALLFGGRLTLMNSVLNNLPLYYFSLFRVPPCVLKKLESVRRIFFWGWSALIGKWWWRFLTEPTSLWVSVIKSIYGASGSIIAGGLNSRLNANSTWSVIAKKGFEIDAYGLEFSSSFKRVIGNGGNTRFWENVWLMDKPLKEVFKRLVRFDVNVHATVSDRVNWDGSGVTSTWSWQREIYERTKDELDELEQLISAVVMVPEKDDSWNWKLCGSGGCFVWRSRRGRLPVLVELDKRGVDLHSVLCPLCGEVVETVKHALFSCKMVRVIWEKIWSWWGIAPPIVIFDGIQGAVSSLQCSGAGNKIWQGMVKVEDNTRITVSGYDKSNIGQFAATIRKWRPPEPYKGKGVKYADEIIRKEGKAGKKK
ncbi:uncharacterized protein [Rutidosis leptorrhynchoides]|uniref:uncharacterized protein n=1 Tax=Rutidosis leptorrhynchoides TaxID=125765 RepID=UPI003A9963C4